MVVRNTLLKRCRVSKELGFQTNLFPYKKLTPRQFDAFLANFPMTPGNRVKELIQKLSETNLQLEISSSIHERYKHSLLTTLFQFPTKK